jgi:hypothetical protein
MDTLFIQNKMGVYRPAPRYAGFVIENRRVPGLRARLQRLKLGGDTSKRLSVFNAKRRPGFRILMGRQGGGISVHALLARSLLENKPPVAKSYVTTCARAAFTFAQLMRWHPWATEMIIRHHKLRIATRFDALFTCHGQFVLVSWKTGRGPRHEADRVRDKTQLAMEQQMLRKAHKIRVSTAYVVYLGALQNMRNSRQFMPVCHAERLSADEAVRLVASAEAKLQRSLVRKKKK